MIDYGSRSIVPIVVSIVALFLLMFGFALVQDVNGLSDLLSTSQIGSLVNTVFDVFLDVYNNLSKWLIIIFAGISGFMGIMHIAEVVRKKAFLNLDYNDTLVDSTPEYIVRLGISDLVKKSNRGAELAQRENINKHAMYVYDVYHIMLHKYLEVYSQFMEIDTRSVDTKMTLPVIQDLIAQINDINLYLDTTLTDIEELTKMCVIPLLENGCDLKCMTVGDVYSHNTSGIDVNTGYTLGYTNDKLSELIESESWIKQVLYDNTQF